ncbi:MAG TPA: YqaJ viral recombinase family protein [Mucilaginibacter sp.]|jgi:putative phage-type endonuclease
MLSEAQIAARAQGIGASEAVILFPEIPNSYSTPYQLWMQKTGKLDSNFEMNDFQWWGHELEPAIAKRYEYETGETLEYRPDTVIHPKLPFMLCHPDRYVFGQRKLVEIKTANFSGDEWGESGTDQIPPAYLLQVQHQLACTGYDEADLIVFFLNFRETRIYPIKRDHFLVEAIENRITSFWNNNVLADVAPELTALSDFKLAFKKNSDLFIEATPEIAECINQLRDIRERMKIEEEIEETILMKICTFLGDAPGLMQDGKNLATWKFDKNGKRTFRISKR